MVVSRTTRHRRSLTIAAAVTLLLTAVSPVSAAAPLYEPCDVQEAATSHPGTAGQSANNDLDCYAVAVRRPDNTSPDYTTDNPYTVRPLLSVGDQVPRTRNNAQSYQMVGIPDGLGIRSLGADDNEDADDDGDRQAVIYMNHEFGTAPFPAPPPGDPSPPTFSQPVIGEAQNRGAFVSTWVLDKDGRVASGDYAYDWVYNEETLVGPIARTDNTTRPFARFCSATLAGREYGFDRTIFFTNEEDGVPANTFDMFGGVSVAIFDQQAHALPKLGHFAKENNVPAPNTGNKTVLFSLEDGPALPDSQLYMWVGEKQRRGSALARNGLLNGTLYVFVSSEAASEATFTSGTINGRWEALSDQTTKTQADLEAEADGKGAFGFVRIEDGAFDLRDPNRFYFATTGDGSQAFNRLGRIYELAFNPLSPTAPTSLTIRQNADTEIAAGRDTAISPDNLDAANGVLMVQEDGTSASRPVMASKGRDGSIWHFDLSTWERTREVELDPPSEDGLLVNPGVWETSGIVTSADVFGRDSWVFDVQAHPPTTAPGVMTVEDGQLLVMYRADRDDLDGDNGDG